MNVDERGAMGSALSTCDERVGAVRATGAGDAGQWRLTRLSGGESVELFEREGGVGHRGGTVTKGVRVC
jgi:hypothetical protein